MRRNLSLGLLALFALLCTVSLAQMTQAADYWREDQNASNVWIDIRKLEPNESMEIHIHNTTSFPPDGDEVFVLFADFNENLGGFSVGGTGTCTADAGISGGNLRVDSGSAAGGCSEHAISSEEYGLGTEFFMYGQVGHGGFNEQRSWGYSNCSGTSCHSVKEHAQFRSSFGIDDLTMRGPNASCDDCFDDVMNITDDAESGNSPAREYSIRRLTNETRYTMRFNNTIERVLYNNSVSFWAPSATEIAFYDTEGPGSGTGGVIVDWTIVRNAVGKEPSLTQINQTTYRLQNIDDNALENYSLRIMDVSYGGNLTVISTLEGGERLSKPKFLNLPVRKGDQPVAAIIYRHDAGKSAEIFVEWQINASTYVKNETFFLAANASKRLNLSTNFSEPGTNITVFVRAESLFGSSERKNATTTVVTPQCTDGIDNDLDTDIDYPADAGCSAPLDNTEDTDNPISTVEIEGVTSCGQPSGGGSTVLLIMGETFIYSGQGFIATEEMLLGEENDTFIEDLLDRSKVDICGNRIDDNENGFIDESCTPLLEVTTSNLQDSYNLYIAPGETRREEVLVENLGGQRAEVEMSCEGSLLCSGVSLMPKEFMIPKADGTREEVQMSISLPEDIELGEKFAFKIVGLDTNQDAIDNILVSVTASERGAGLRKLAESLTRPIFCTDVASEGARNFCIPLWVGILLGTSLGLLLLFILRLIFFSGGQRNG